MITVQQFFADFPEEDQAELAPIQQFLTTAGAQFELDLEGSESDQFLYKAIINASAHDNWQVVFEHAGHRVSRLPAANVWLWDWKYDMIGGTPILLFIG